MRQSVVFHLPIEDLLQALDVLSVTCGPHAPRFQPRHVLSVHRLDLVCRQLAAAYVIYDESLGEVLFVAVRTCRNRV